MPNNVRPIDANGLKAEATLVNLGTEWYPVMERVVYESDIDEAPTIDAVPVIRCIACQHYEEDCGYCQYWETSRRTEDYCSRGVRRSYKEDKSNATDIANGGSQ